MSNTDVFTTEVPVDNGGTEMNEAWIDILRFNTVRLKQQSAVRVHLKPDGEVDILPFSSSWDYLAQVIKSGVRGKDPSDGLSFLEAIRDDYQSSSRSSTTNIQFGSPPPMSSSSEEQAA